MFLVHVTLSNFYTKVFFIRSLNANVKSIKIFYLQGHYLHLLPFGAGSNLVPIAMCI